MDFETKPLPALPDIVAPDGSDVRVLSGHGEMWRSRQERQDVVTLEPGICITIPVGTHFQFRAAHGESLKAVGVTMPPWPGPGEAIPVAGKWDAKSS